MKKKHKLIVLMFLIVCFSFLSMHSVSAYVTFLDTKMIGGIRNRYYYLDSSITGAWSTPVYNAINRWYNTETYFAFGQTTNKNSSQLDFYAYSSSSDGNNGYTIHYLRTGEVADVGLQNWKFCSVYMNMEKLKNTTTDFDTGVMCHEIGHACGLNENNTNQYSIMCQEKYGRRVTSPGSDDVAGLNYLYPTGYFNP